ncbi:hypothetical protein [Micromonospora sp. NPDC005324]|uniref:hypothetical protein n=1 Tax=Micromonospora sp. NPDC005324 TaxID=3157033 RepID=UPI0033B21D72
MNISEPSPQLQSKDTRRTALQAGSFKVAHRGFDWPADAPDPFDVGHEEAASFYWAHGRPSRLLAGAGGARLADLYRAIPPGYTTLDLMCRVAVANRGKILRAWAGVEMEDLKQPYQLVLAANEAGNYLRLGTNWPLRSALSSALSLSARCNDAVLLCVVMRSDDWH